MQKGKPVPGLHCNEKAMLGRKDAFHVAGILVQSSQTIRRGEFVLVDTRNHEVAPKSRAYANAVADPFMQDAYPGTMFWVFCMQEYVGDLTHTFNFPVDTITDAEPEEPKSFGEPEPDYCDYSQC